MEKFLYQIYRQTYIRRTTAKIVWDTLNYGFITFMAMQKNFLPELGDTRFTPNLNLLFIKTFTTGVCVYLDPDHSKFLLIPSSSLIRGRPHRSPSRNRGHPENFFFPTSRKDIYIKKKPLRGDMFAQRFFYDLLTGFLSFWTMSRRFLFSFCSPQEMISSRMIVGKFFWNAILDCFRCPWIYCDTLNYKQLFNHLGIRDITFKLK